MRLVSTKSLTRGERLLILRRRYGATQVQFALRYNVSLYKYRLWETDAADPGYDAKLTRPGSTARHQLRQHEQCYILRRRHKLTRQDIAGLVGCSQLWVTLMERGREDCTVLAEWWGAVL